MGTVNHPTPLTAAALHRRAVESWQERLDAVPADRWQERTPCAAWTVRDLVNHVVAEELWAVPLLAGATLEEVGDRFDGDVLGDDPAGSGRSAAAAATAAVEERLPEGGKVQLSYGDEDVEEYVRQLAADHLVHGWDLAVATGGDPGLDPELVDAVAGWYAEREGLYRSAGIVGPHVQRSGDPQTELLAAFGRDARWAATP